MEQNETPSSLNALDGMFSFDGRLNRLPFFLIVTIAWPVGYVLTLTCFQNLPNINAWVAVFAVIWVWLSLSSIVRRLHDVGIGGTKCFFATLLLMAVPFSQWLLLFVKWQATENEWWKPIM